MYSSYIIFRYYLEGAMTFSYENRGHDMHLVNIKYGTIQKQMRIFKFCKRHWIAFHILV
jgi:hypothetical protein